MNGLDSGNPTTFLAPGRLLLLDVEHGTKEREVRPSRQREPLFTTRYPRSTAHPAQPPNTKTQNFPKLSSKGTKIYIYRVRLISNIILNNIIEVVRVKRGLKSI
jgi:hypothetical protein